MGRQILFDLILKQTKTSSLEDMMINIKRQNKLYIILLFFVYGNFFLCSFLPYSFIYIPFDQCFVISKY